MGQVIPFSRFASQLDLETLKVASVAYDLVVAHFNDDDASDKLCERIASRIIQASLEGQRDIFVLYRIGLTAIAPA